VEIVDMVEIALEAAAMESAAKQTVGEIMAVVGEIMPVAIEDTGTEGRMPLSRINFLDMPLSRINCLAILTLSRHVNSKICKTQKKSVKNLFFFS